MNVCIALLFAFPAVASASNCNWDSPGKNPFSGDIARAVDRYQDIPPSIRMELQRKIRAGELDDVVDIRRDSITSKQAAYGPEITHMHFGRGKVCSSVTRGGWSLEHVEKAKVFCSSGYCLLVPRICNNLSRIVRLEQAPAEVIDNGGVGSVAGPGGQPAPGWGFGMPEVPELAPAPAYEGFGVMPGPAFNGCCFRPPAAPVSPVPELGQWAMMLAGLALILIYQRRNAE